MGSKRLRRHEGRGRGRAIQETSYSPIPTQTQTRALGVRDAQSRTPGRAC